MNNMLGFGAALILSLIVISAQAEENRTAPSCIQGENLFDSHNYHDAQEALWRCILEGRYQPEFALHLAWTYKDVKNYDQGLIHVSKALEEQPSNEDLLYVAAFLHFRRGELEKSVDFLNRAYRLSPDDWRLHQLYALNFVEVGWSSAVEQELNRAVKLKPDMPELYYQLARYYYTMNEFDKAITASEQALALFPDYASVYDNLGLSYAGLGDPKHARESFEKAMAINEKQGGKDEWPIIDYAASIEEHDPNEALLLLQRALQFNSANPTANYELGRTLRRLGRYEEAELYLTTTIKLDPTYTTAYYLLFSLVQKRGDSALAAEYLARFRMLRDKEKSKNTMGDVLSAKHR